MQNSDKSLQPSSKYKDPEMSFIGPIMSEENSYGQILKSSSIMGFVSVFILMLGMIRTKFSAILIGITGVGLVTNFMAIQSFVANMAGLGLQSSAVRELAAAYAKGDNQLLGETVSTLRRICWLSGIAGAIMMILIAPLISQITFGSNQYQWDITALSLMILFGNLVSGKMALLQGSRRIGDMAKAQLGGALAGSFITIGLYFWVGSHGIIPALILTVVIQFVISGHYTKFLHLPEVQMSWRQTFNKSGSMVRIGFVMMCISFMASAVNYAIIALINNQINLQAVGIYSTAFAVSGMFINFILSAMSADYYPRIASAGDDTVKINRLINEQTEVGLLLAAPGLLIVMLLAPYLVEIFYTKEFLAAVELIHWFILGCIARLISWPLGYVLIAQGRLNWLFGSELFIHSLHFILIYIGLSLYGIEGVAIAFLILYMIHVILMHSILKKLIRFSWTILVFKNIFWNLFIFGFALLVVNVFDNHWHLIIGIILIVFSFTFSWIFLRRHLRKHILSIPILLKILNFKKL